MQSISLRYYCRHPDPKTQRRNSKDCVNGGAAIRKVRNATFGRATGWAPLRNFRHVVYWLDDKVSSLRRRWRHTRTSAARALRHGAVAEAVEEKLRRGLSLRRRGHVYLQRAARQCHSKPRERQSDRARISASMVGRS